MLPVSARTLRTRRSIVVILLLMSLLVGSAVTALSPQPTNEDLPQAVLAEATSNERAIDVLETLDVKGRAPKTGYARDQFSDGWADAGNCDVRNIVLAMQLTDVVYGSDDCTVLSGKLNDPYTGAQIMFVRGASTSGAVQIDHVVALSDAWQKGAQQLSELERHRLANDTLNLLAVDGPANQKKSDADAASWLPPNKAFRCQYVARQIAVKRDYHLWVSEAEKSAMKRVLGSCKEQRLPVRANEMN